ncbi:porin family protein [Flammeovirga yaeyamensis]|uniref:Porin family protein n=1 Tax=Flammeovirga yaeyamensis TaxID=367791 RepID=A0AAX1N879_9BACT|nr:outer membrane beta-barrel protein [Flammeovirga yaeyamensis]MBB3698882.1 hypothetical protein [Flammeovirga yaeyamensis]NMF37466.1 porin family protein [Flammeovirga yaeyamensis]QWG03721.1 porin family protein [Flammeovirga yaeyamensis]
MKKLAIILFLSFLGITTYAQDKLVTVGFGGGISNVSEKGSGLDMNGLGGNYHVMALFNITPKLSVGAEYGGSYAVLAPENLDKANFEATKFKHFSGKVLYHFSESRIRPYLGFGVGSYSVTPGKMNIQNSDNPIVLTFNKSTTVGYAPEFGVDFGWFSLAAIYHIVPDVKVYNNEYEKVNVNYNSLEFRTTFNINFAQR